MIGKCSNCDTQVMDLNRRGQDRFLLNYRDHIVELSNNTLMRVGVCVNCKVLLESEKTAQETAENILNKHKTYWENDEYAPIGFKEFTIINPDTNETKFNKKRELKNNE